MRTTKLQSVTGEPAARQLTCDVACRLSYTGCGKKSSPLKCFAVFSETVWNTNLKFLQFYLIKPSTSNCQAKCDSAEK